MGQGGVEEVKQGEDSLDKEIEEIDKKNDDGSVRASAE